MRYIQSCLSLYSDIKKKIYSPRALSVTWVSQTLHWLLVRKVYIEYQQAHQCAVYWFMSSKLYIILSLLLFTLDTHSPTALLFKSTILTHSSKASPSALFMIQNTWTEFVWFLLSSTKHEFLKNQAFSL